MTDSDKPLHPVRHRSLSRKTERSSKGALETYAIRLKLVLKRNRIEKDAGDAVFDKLTATADLGSIHLEFEE